MYEKNRLPFRTGLLVTKSGHRHSYPKPPFKGRGWHIDYSVYSGRHHRDCDEVVIYAQKQLAAQKILNVTSNCMELINGQRVNPFGEMSLLAYNENDDNGISHFNRQFFETSCTPLACSLATKVTCKNVYIYALAKYNFSVSLYNRDLVDLEPWSSPHLPVSKHPEDHVAFCHAIVAAYSVLEEMGLEVRASNTRPSMINGKWNPEVRFDLENRLRKARINLSEKMLWTIRGPRRKIESKKQINTSEKMPWSFGPVRDAGVEIVDAIAYASWLRSKVSSHKTIDITRSISPYDVISTQHLARRLLLEHFGMWRDYFRNLEGQTF